VLYRGRDGVQQGVEAGQNEAFEDVQLGPLLGQGGFGKVYRGLWNGAAVAVKVCFIIIIIIVIYFFIFLFFLGLRAMTIGLVV